MTSEVEGARALEEEETTLVAVVSGQMRMWRTWKLPMGKMRM
jgi:hypothetical protein